MASNSNSDSGDKTEKPTQKRLRDARKKGEVPKSKEVTSTLVLLAWLGLGASALPLVTNRISGLIVEAIDSVGQPFSHSLPRVGWAAIETTLWAMGLLLLPVIMVALASEYMQAGPVFTFERLKPKLENMNPASGVKRMFSMDNLIEVLKSAAKTAVMLLIGWLVIKSLLPQIVLLSNTTPSSMSAATWQITLKLLSWTIAVFALVSVLDVAWQHHSFTKKNRMSLHEIKKEHKENEGDPYVKAHRRRAHQEWSQRNAVNAAAKANVLVVNPTHVAIAIDYDDVHCPVPMVADKGEDDLALAMRAAAEEAGVPVVRNVALARELLAGTETGDSVPVHLFDVIAEVILWARDVREQIQEHEQNALSPAEQAEAGSARRAAPGEDLTRYPDGFQRSD